MELNDKVETGFDKELNDKQYMDSFFEGTNFGGLVYGEDRKAPKPQNTNNEISGQIGQVQADIDHECDVVSDLLVAYVDNSCTLYSKDFVKKHLEHCEVCRRTVLNMQQDVQPSKITDAETTLNVLKKSMNKKIRTTIITLTALFTCLACAVCFWFIARTVRNELEEDYRSAYQVAVNKYEEERKRGSEADDLEERIWQMVESSRASSEK